MLSTVDLKLGNLSKICRSEDTIPCCCIRLDTQPASLGVLKLLLLEVVGVKGSREETVWVGVAGP